MLVFIVFETMAGNNIFSLCTESGSFDRLKVLCGEYIEFHMYTGPCSSTNAG